MSSKNLFKTLNQQAVLEAKCGIPAGKSLSHAKDQIRVDLHSQGFSWTRLHSNQIDGGGMEETDSYESALRLLQQKLSSSNFIRNGQVLLTNLWPSNIQIQPIHQQISQKFNSLQDLDLTAQVAPSQLNLTPGFIYRTIEKKADRTMHKNGDLIGLPIAGLEGIQNDLPSVSRMSRHWGALSVLQTIVSRFYMELPETLLLGIVETQRVHYFSLRKLQLSGLRSSARSSLRETGDLHSTIMSLGGETSCILFINLTMITDDLQKITEELEKNKKWTIRSMGRHELLQAFPDLNTFAHAPLFPLSFLIDRPSTTPSEISSPGFVTASEALTPQITATQCALLKTQRLFKTIAFLTTMTIVGWLSYQLYREIISPEWSLQPETARGVKAKYDEFLHESQEYQSRFKSLTTFPRFDLVAEPLLNPPPEGFTLEEIKFNSRPILKNPTQKSFEILVQGNMAHGDLLQLRDYAHTIELKMQQNLPDFSVTVGESGLSEKMNNSMVSFRLNIKIESKSHGPI